MSVCMYASKSRTSKICDTRDASQGPPLPREKMMDGWMEGGREGGMEGGRDGWMDGPMDGWMYVYVCMYVLVVCMHMCVYVCVYVYIYIYMYIYMHTCMYIYSYRVSGQCLIVLKPKPYSARCLPPTLQQDKTHVFYLVRPSCRQVRNTRP